jgi:starch phosphorylase
MTVPNGANPRRWIHNANRELSMLITEEIGDESEWLTNLDLLQSLGSYVNDEKFLKKFF